MAKATPKAAPKKVAAKSSAKPKPKSVKALDIEKAAKLALAKLKDLGLDTQLQADLEWCIGSYGFDKNPDGLIKSTEKAVKLFVAEKTKKTKGITAKLITDIEGALKK
jgi:hypothetical protein